MNYINQIRSFWRLHEEHSFSTTEIAVYFYLLEACNSCGWKNPFKRNNSRIRADLGICRNTLANARNKLVQTGLLQFKTQNGNSNTQYCLSNFEQVAGQVNGQVTEQVSGEVQSTKYKLKKTKKNKTLSPSLSNNLDDENENEKAQEETAIANQPNGQEEKRKSCAKKKKENHTPALSLSPSPSPQEKGTDSPSPTLPQREGVGNDDTCTPVSVEETPPLFGRGDWGGEAAFARFLAYRKEMGKPFRTQQGIDQCYKRLLELSGGNPHTAIRIVEQSIANEWQGLFALKQTHSTHERTATTTSLTPSTSSAKYGADKWNTTAARIAAHEQA